MIISAFLFVGNCDKSVTKPAEDRIAVVDSLVDGSLYFAIGSNAKYCCDPDSLGMYPVKVTYYVTKVTDDEIDALLDVWNE